jgi:hypothetical protein
MFERYTERARRVIFFGRYEASQFGSTSIEVDHLLLGMLREDHSLFARFLRGASLDSIRKEVTDGLEVREKVPTSIDLPLTEEGKLVFKYASEEAERLKHNHIGTEHLLLGILRVEKSPAARILSNHGMNIEEVRAELARAPMPVESSMPPPPTPVGAWPLPTLLTSPALPKPGVVPDAETAKRIAEAVWVPLYGVEEVANQAPSRAELKYNVWVVTGSAAPDRALFAFILQADGRILSVGCGRPNT